MQIKAWAKLAYIRQSRRSMASDKVLSATRVQRNHHLVELAMLGAQTGFDVAQALAVSQLCKCHREVLIETTERLGVTFALVTRHTAPKRLQR